MRWKDGKSTASHQAWEPPADTELSQKDAKETTHRKKIEPIL